MKEKMMDSSFVFIEKLLTIVLILKASSADEFAHLFLFFCLSSDEVVARRERESLRVFVDEFLEGLSAGAVCAADGVEWLHIRDEEDGGYTLVVEGRPEIVVAHIDRRKL